MILLEKEYIVKPQHNNFLLYLQYVCSMYLESEISEKWRCPMNPYSVLGIQNSAGKDEIRKAYRDLARKFHPDSNAGNKEAEEKFKEINDAYAILSDEKKKEQYDREESMKKSSVYEKEFQQKAGQKTARAAKPQRTTSNRAKGDFKTDRESIYNQFSDFFGFKM